MTDDSAPQETTHTRRAVLKSAAGTVAAAQLASVAQATAEPARPVAGGASSRGSRCSTRCASGSD
ncbi:MULTISPECIES: hypothetical protein [Amycolatopsis]|uniref:hypothetical protein n=1 Tax=Amycolatopsis TaxID=1813 RepID=UPI001E408646|nr:hypothetical protein [Amycolatopsis bullii]